MDGRARVVDGDIDVCGLGAWGCYLLLTQRNPTPRRTGIAVVAITLAAILTLFPLAGGYSIITLSPSFFATIAFLIPAGCGFAATLAIITCRSRRSGLACLAAAVLANTALFFVSRAAIAGAMNLIVNLGFLGTLLLYAALPHTKDEPPPVPVSKFAWLACPVTALLLAGLLSAIPLTHVVDIEPTREATVAVGDTTGFSWSDLGRSLLFDHGISLTVVSLLLFVAMITVARMMAGGASEFSAQPVEGRTA